MSSGPRGVKHQLSRCQCLAAGSWFGCRNRLLALIRDTANKPKNIEAANKNVGGLNGSIRRPSPSVAPGIAFVAWTSILQDLEITRNVTFAPRLPLLVNIVAGRTRRRCLSLFVALDTRIHRSRSLFGDHVYCQPPAVAVLTANKIPIVEFVGEPEQVGHLIDLYPWHRLFRLVERRELLDLRTIGFDYAWRPMKSLPAGVLPQIRAFDGMAVQAFHTYSRM